MDFVRFEPHFMDPWQTSDLTRHLYAFDETDGSNFPQRAQAKLFFGTVKLFILILKRTDGISQFYNHPGN